jgi:putative flippase GtrA
MNQSEQGTAAASDPPGGEAQAMLMFLRRLAREVPEDPGRPLRFFWAGLLNTAVGYGVGVGLYLLLTRWLATPVIGVLASLLTINVTFTTQRVFVFRSRAPWWPEYFRSYVVFGGTAATTILLQWLLVDSVGISIWWSQGIMIPVGVLITYIGHARFTFAGRPGDG